MLLSTAKVASQTTISDAIYGISAVARRRVRDVSDSSRFVFFVFVVLVVLPLGFLFRVCGGRISTWPLGKKNDVDFRDLGAGARHGAGRIQSSAWAAALVVAEGTRQGRPELLLGGGGGGRRQG